MSYYWVMLYHDNGRGFLDHRRFTSDLRADRYLETKYDGKGEVFETEYGDRTKALQEIRQKLAERGSSSTWGRNFDHKNAPQVT